MSGRSRWPDHLTPAAVHILLALSDEDRHGLGIVEEVERLSGGQMLLGPGTLYGTIKRMRDGGLIEESGPPQGMAGGDPRRRYYRITPDGRKAARTELQRVERMVRAAREKAVLDPLEQR
jgi:DNA-binding PadR family transcriptional regulator